MFPAPAKIRFLDEISGQIKQSKTSKITADYDISGKVLGYGINGKVVVCTSKATKEKYALKVSLDLISY